MPDDIDIDYEYEKAKAAATATAVPAAPRPAKVLKPSGYLEPDDSTAHFPLVLPRDEESLSAKERADTAANLENLGYYFKSDAEIPKTRGEARRMHEAGMRAEFARHARVPEQAQEYARATTDPVTQRQIEEKVGQYKAADEAAHERAVEEMPYKKAAFLQGVGIPLKWLGASEEQRRLISEGQEKHPISTFLSSSTGTALPFGAAMKVAKFAKVADWLAPTVAGGVTGAEQVAASGGTPQQIVEGGLEGGALVTGLGVAGAVGKAQKIGMAKDRAIEAVNTQRGVLSEARGASRELDAYLKPGRTPANLEDLPRLVEEAKAKTTAFGPSAPVEPPKVALTATPDKFHKAVELVGKSSNEALSGLEAETVGPKPAELSTLPAVFEAKHGEMTGEGLTSVKNRVVNEERAARGVDPLPDATYRPQPAVLAEARAAIAADPGAAETLAREVASKPRPLTDTDVFLLDMRRVDLNKARKSADAEYTAAVDGGDPDAAIRAKTRGDQIGDQLLELEAASQAGGTKSAQGLAARIRMMREDYSLGNMETQARKAGSGERLSNVESAQVKGLNAEIEKIRAERDAYQARLAERESGRAVEEIARPTRTSSRSADYGKSNRLVTKESYAKALAEFKGTTLSMGIDPSKLAAAAKVALYHLEAAPRSFAAWAKTMKEELGDSVEPHLKALWAGAQRDLSGKTIEDVTARIKAGVGEGKTIDQMPAEAGKIAEMFYRQGITERGPLIDAVHGELEKIVPGLSKRETMDAISGYGKTKALDSDPVKVELRELKGQMLQLSKLEDMAAGSPPQRTGLERQPPFEVQSELIKEVNAAKKSGGFGRSEAEIEISALKAVKTRKENRIKELEGQMARGEANQKAKRTVKPDAELVDINAREAMTVEKWHRFLFDKKMANRSRAQVAADTVLQTAQTARAVMTSFDLSAPLRQGLFYVAARPLKSRAAFAEMFRALKSPEAQARAEAAMRMDPDFAAAKRHGVFFNETGGVSITKMEEEFMSRWAGDIPGVAGSQRAYTTFLNKARLDYFKTLTAAFKDGPIATPAEMKAIASFVNVATGRGGPIGAGAGFLAGANHILFSPRLLLSRLQILSGAPLIKGAFASKRVAKIIAWEYGRFLTGVGTMYGAALAAKKAGLDVDITFDPRATDFGKLRFGHTRLDPLGGLAQVVRLAGNTVTGQKVRGDERVVDLVDSKKRSEENLGDVWGRFLRSKLAPIPGAVWSAATKKDVVGNRTNWGRELSGLALPMSLGGKDLFSTATRDAPPKMEFVTGSDVYQAMKEHGVPEGAAIWVLSLFGMGLQHYESKEKAKAGK